MFNYLKLLFRLIKTFQEFPNLIGFVRRGSGGTVRYKEVQSVLVRGNNYNDKLTDGSVLGKLVIY